jgi:quinol monooxygenase YgiN
VRSAPKSAIEAPNQETHEEKAASDRRRAMIEMVKLDFHLTPLRAEKFAALYRPIVPRVMAYGAQGYAFYRSEEDSDHFVHASLWEDRSDFQRFWFSREMTDMRQKTNGLYGQPLLPDWSTILDRG